MIYRVGLDPYSAFLQRLDFRPLQHRKDGRAGRLSAPAIGFANDSCGEKKMRRHPMCAQDRQSLCEHRPYPIVEGKCYTPFCLRKQKRIEVKDGKVPVL